MKKTIKKWLFRLSVTALVITSLLLIIVLNPIITYAGKTESGPYHIYHHKKLNPLFPEILKEATTIISKTELFDPSYKLDICLNDGAAYPSIIQKIKGPAFAVGFYNKVVLLGNANVESNFVELNGYKWNLSQLLAHEMMHCFQYKQAGFWKSNPVANIPAWKWEGYPQFIARQNQNQTNLIKNIDRLVETEKTDHNGWINFADGTVTVIDYYKNWLLVQYCMEVKNQNWEQLLKDKSSETDVHAKMMHWYKLQKS